MQAKIRKHTLKLNTAVTMTTNELAESGPLIRQLKEIWNRIKNTYTSYPAINLQMLNFS